MPDIYRELTGGTLVFVEAPHEAKAPAAGAQGSPEWRAARLGRVTASRVADVIAKGAAGARASRKNYLAELVIERLTGAPAASFVNDAMKWGLAQEPLAREAYALRFDVEVAQVGFIPHPAIEMAGASPDGLVGAEGQVEIKCPNSATHIETLLGAPLRDRYATQIQWQLACTGRAWCDFVSFDPRMPEHLRLHIERVARDPGRIAELEDEVRKFLFELEATLGALRALEASAEPSAPPGP